MSTETIAPEVDDLDAEVDENQFVTFAVADEMFATPMAPVQEIIRVPAVARVPLAPAALLGLANLRGRVLPIVSLRHIFGLPEVEETDSTRALVIDLGTPLGFVVDRVASVITVDPQDLEPVADIQTTVQTELLTGVVKSGGESLVMVLDFARIIQREFAAIAEAANERTRSVVDSTVVEESEEEGERDEVQLVSFTVERQEFAAEIASVQEIVQAPQSIVRVPNAPPHVLGLMLLRERLLPLLSLRQLLGLPAAPLDETQRVVVLALGAGQAVGVVADSVDEVLRVPKSEVEPVPALLSKEGVEKVSSICRLEGGKRLVSVIDTARLVDHQGVRAVMDEAASMSAANTDEGMAESNGDAEDLDEEEQVVVFRLGAEEFGVPIMAVQEIVRVPDQLTRVPTAPDFVEGVINLRGTALPVIDQRRRLGLPSVERNDRQRIMVYALQGGRTGFIVDAVTEVLKIPRTAIEPSPRLSGQQSRILDRMANLQEQKRLILLVRPEALLSEEEMADLAQTR